MSCEEEQQFLNVITNASTKLDTLRKILSMEELKKNKEKREQAFTSTDATEENYDELEFQRQCQKEADERKSLLQALISESEAAGFPLPPSLIKLLHSTNCKYCNERKFINITI